MDPAGHAGGIRSGPPRLGMVIAQTRCGTDNRRREKSPPFGIASGEKVAERPGVKHRRPPLPAMRCPVMGEVAALAERREISGSVVAGVLIEMGGGEDDEGQGQGPWCKARQDRL